MGWVGLGWVTHIAITFPTGLQVTYSQVHRGLLWSLQPWKEVRPSLRKVMYTTEACNRGGTRAQ